MNKKFLILLCFIVIFASIISAQTTITGTISNEDNSEKVSGAKITIYCDDNIINTVSMEDGSYSGYYAEKECNSESDLSVYAYHPNYGFSQDGAGIYDNQAIVNLSLNRDEEAPLVPEFTGIIAGLTILGALGAFLIVRKR